MVFVYPRARNERTLFGSQRPIDTLTFIILAIVGLKPRRLFILEWGRRKTLHLAHKIFTK